MDAFIDAARQNSCRAISKSCRRVLDGKSRAASETTWEAMSLFSQICLSRDICFFLPLISSQLPSSLSLNQFTAWEPCEEGGCCWQRKIWRSEKEKCFWLGIYRLGTMVVFFSNQWIKFVLYVLIDGILYMQRKIVYFLSEVSCAFLFYKTTYLH